MKKDVQMSNFLTAGFVIAGVAVGLNHYKSKGFWWGVGAMLLIGTTVAVHNRK